METAQVTAAAVTNVCFSQDNSLQSAIEANHTNDKLESTLYSNKTINGDISSKISKDHLNSHHQNQHDELKESHLDSSRAHQVIENQCEKDKDMTTSTAIIEKSQDDSVGSLNAVNTHTKEDHGESGTSTWADESGGHLVQRKTVSSVQSKGERKASGESVKNDGIDDSEEGKKSQATDGEFGLHVFNSCRGQHLLRLKDMPVHLQFNRHVHSGYRRLHDVWGCFWSLFYLHNETVNIFTHAIPIVWVLVFWRSMYPWEAIEGNTFLNILGWSHVIASISPWLGSVTYHLFMNHQGGAKLYHLLLQLDMFGIWVTECFGALTNLSASTWCLPGNLQTIIIIMYAVGSIWGLQKAMTAWTPLARRMCFAPVFITRILGFFLRISRFGGGEPDILIHVILQDAVSLVGGMIGVIRIPEKWFPGKLDLFCNSHHIMHVLVVLAVFHMNQATNGDIRWIIKNYSQSQCAAKWWDPYAGIIAFFTYSQTFPRP